MERRGRRSLHIGISYIIVIHGRTMCAPTFCLDICRGGRPRPPESFVRTDGSPGAGSPTNLIVQSASLTSPSTTGSCPRRSTSDNSGCGEMERRGRRSLHIGISYIIVIHGRTMCAPTFCLDICRGGRPRPPESFVRTDGSPGAGSPTNLIVQSASLTSPSTTGSCPRRSTSDNSGCGEMERRGRRSLHIGISYIIVIHGRTMCAPTILIRPRSGHHNYALRITNYALNKSP